VCNKKTSKIKIRPYVPYLKDEDKEGREPFAILKYGNIEVELDYTIIRYLDLDVSSDNWIKTRAIFISAMKEIDREMTMDLTGEMIQGHRDSKTRYVESITHNPLHPINSKHISR